MNSIDRGKSRMRRTTADQLEKSVVIRRISVIRGLSFFILRIAEIERIGLPSSHKYGIVTEADSPHCTADNSGCRDSMTDLIEQKRRLNERLQVGLPAHLGIRMVDLAQGCLILELALQSNHAAANGYLHAGTVVTLADTACGFGCLANLPEGSRNFTTLELKTNFLRTATSGTIRAEATLQHAGRRTQIWDAVVRDDTERTMALFRCTQMILYR